LDKAPVVIVVCLGQRYTLRTLSNITPDDPRSLK
jgi:hypothetical protein